MLFFMMIQVFPALAWDYNDGTASDAKFEEFGPRANNLLINLYFDAETEWDALEAGEIDITDWALTETYYNRFTTPPQDGYINSMFYGGEFGIFLLDINNNNNEFLGLPQDPLYPNAVYPNNPFATVEGRQAVCYLHRKSVWLPTIVGVGFYEEMHTTHPSAYGAYSLATADPYPYSPATAAALFDSIGVIYDAGQHPYRFYDLNTNGVYDGGDEQLTIVWAIRSDHYHRNAMGDLVADEMVALNFDVTREYGPSSYLGAFWFYGKTAHFYTAGWNLGVEPDHVVLWLSDFYWHPGFCYNTGYVNDPELDTYAYGTWLANTEADALTNCLAFQQRMMDIAGCYPWFTYAASKAIARTYTGGTNGTIAGDDEDPFRGQYWDGAVSVSGYGVDSFFSMLNMHPRGFETDDDDMTIRWAYKTDTLKSFNPVYSEWLWEWNTLGLIYDTLLVRNPYSLLELVPWLCSAYETTTYEHPVYGTTSKVAFTLRPDIHFSDGTPLTVADIYFTWVELADIVIGRGLPPPWWYSSVAHILSFTVFDAYNFECLLDVKSVYATMWIGGMVILPKHIWKPLCEGTVGDVQAAAADPDMIGPGPWRFVEYVANSHVLLTANMPEKTVTTNHAGSTAVYSPTGYCRYFPAYAETYISEPVELERRTKVPYDENVTIVSEFTNLMDTDAYTWTTIEVDEGAGWLAPIVDNDTEVVGFNAKPHTLVIHAIIRWFDYEYSWWHWRDDPGPTGRWTYTKVGRWRIQGYIKIYYCGTLRYERYINYNLRIRITRTIRTYDFPFPTCKRFTSDYGLSWHTLITDIAGSTWYDQVALYIEPELGPEGLYAFDFAAYPHKTQLPTADIKVDIKDVALAAKGFGAFPGHGRWSAVADINGDYKIDIKDIASIAKDFGWVG